MDPKKKKKIPHFLSVLLPRQAIGPSQLWPTYPPVPESHELVGAPVLYVYVYVYVTLALESK